MKQTSAFHVLILHHAPAPADQGGVWRESDAGVMDECKAVSEILSELGVSHRTVGVTRLEDLPTILAASTENIIFNLVEGMHPSASDANLVPALCRAYGKSCTGTDTPGLILAQDKWKTKSILRSAGLDCPEGILVPVGQRVPRSKLPAGPYIVKPVANEASEGIDGFSVIEGAATALNRAVRTIHEEFGQPALIERFVGRRELNVALLEIEGRVRALPIAEINFEAFGEDRPRIVGYSAKWLMETFEYNNTPRIIPAPLTARQAERVRSSALVAWHALGCRDYARVDFRLDERGTPFVLEVNPNPDITPGDGFPAALEAAHISYKEFVLTLLRNATSLSQGGQAKRTTSAESTEKKDAPLGIIRSVSARDRARILEFLKETGRFRPEEILTAEELLDDAIAKGDASHYQSFILEEAGLPVGWVCFGPTPCTVGTFDIYWLVVAPDRQARGLGGILMKHAESIIGRLKGQLAVVETSSREDYLAARRFYEKMGYRENGRIENFYAPGDDRIIYTKPLGAMQQSAK
jgi:D-alanine-D-alanine ligase